VHRDLLGDYRVVIRGHCAAGIAQQQRRPSLEFAGEHPRTRAGANLREADVDCVGGDFASRHIDDFEPRPLLQKTDRKIGQRPFGDGGKSRDFTSFRNIAVLIGITARNNRFCDDFSAAWSGKMRGDLRAVSELARRTDYRGDGEFDAGHVIQQLGNLPAFPFQLLGIDQMLILAAAAAPEEGAAGRLNTVRRGCQDCDEIGFGIVLVIPENPRADPFSGQRERNHDDPPAGHGRRSIEL